MYMCMCMYINKFIAVRLCVVLCFVYKDGYFVEDITNNGQQENRKSYLESVRQQNHKHAKDITSITKPNDKPKSQLAERKTDR